MSFATGICRALLGDIMSTRGRVYLAYSRTALQGWLQRNKDAHVCSLLFEERRKLDPFSGSPSLWSFWHRQGLVGPRARDRVQWHRQPGVAGFAPAYHGLVGDSSTVMGWRWRMHEGQDVVIDAGYSECAETVVSIDAGQLSECAASSPLFGAGHVAAGVLLGIEPSAYLHVPDGEPVFLL